MTNETKGGWQSRALSQTFLGGVLGALPGADLQLAVIGKIIEQWNPEPERVLDLGCGNGILGRFLLEQFHSAKALLLDFSEPLIEAARKNVVTLVNATVAVADFGSPQWLEVDRPHGPFDLVVSGFAIHHQPTEF